MRVARLPASDRTVRLRFCTIAPPLRIESDEHRSHTALPVGEESAREAHVTRPSLRRAASRGFGIALKVDAHGIRTLVVVEQALGLLEGLCGKFRLHPDMPLERQRVRGVEASHLDRIAVVRENDRRHTVPADGLRRELSDEIRAERSAYPERLARRICGLRGREGNRAGLLRNLKRPEWICLHIPAFDLIDERRVLAGTVVYPARVPVGKDGADEELARLHVHAVARIAGEKRVHVDSVFGV